MLNQNCTFDYGNSPFITNLDKDVFLNNNFRTARWTGTNLQLTLMCIPIGSEIGLEIHPEVDQFLYIEAGNGFAMMGKDKNSLDYQGYVSSQYAIFIPAGTWHNVKNTGNCALKLFSIYAPPQHPFGTIHHCRPDDDEHGY